jgi:hypothetical protein
MLQSLMGINEIAFDVLRMFCHSPLAAVWGLYSRVQGSFLEQVKYCYCWMSIIQKSRSIEDLNTYSV